MLQNIHFITDRKNNFRLSILFYSFLLINLEGHNLQNSSTGSDGVVNSVEMEELRCELGLLKDDLQQAQFVIYNLKGDIQVVTSLIFIST